MTARRNEKSRRKANAIQRSRARTPFDKERNQSYLDERYAGRPVDRDVGAVVEVY